MIKLKYPGARHDFYLVFDIIIEAEPEFEGNEWDVTKLHGFSEAGVKGMPFSASLSELMKVSENIK